MAEVGLEYEIRRDYKRSKLGHCLPMLGALTIKPLTSQAHLNGMVQDASEVSKIFAGLCSIRQVQTWDEVKREYCIMTSRVRASPIDYTWRPTSVSKPTCQQLPIFDHGMNF